MANPDGRIVLLIIVAFALFAAGRRWQQMRDRWAEWRGTVAAVPVKRKAAWVGVRTMVRVGLIAAVVFWVASSLDYFM